MMRLAAICVYNKGQKLTTWKKCSPFSLIWHRFRLEILLFQPYNRSQSLYKLSYPQSKLEKLFSKNREADDEWEEPKNLMQVRWIALFPASFSVSYVASLSCMIVGVVVIGVFGNFRRQKDGRTDHLVVTKYTKLKYQCISLSSHRMVSWICWAATLDLKEKLDIGKVKSFLWHLECKKIWNLIDSFENIKK